MAISLTLVLPCYNPEKNWVTNILIRHNELASLLKNYEVSFIIVNDGSILNIEADLNQLSLKLPNCKIVSYTQNKGKGYALRKGIEAANTDFIVYTDIDFPYNNESLIKIIESLKKNDVAIGIRGESYYDNIPYHRAFISKILRFSIKKLLRIPTDDTQGGLKGMKKEIKPYFLQTEINRYLFDLEFICIAAKNKLKLDLIPVVLNENTLVKKMNMKVVSKELVNFFKVYIKMGFN